MPASTIVTTIVLVLWAFGLGALIVAAIRRFGDRAELSRLSQQVSVALAAIASIGYGVYLAATAPGKTAIPVFYVDMISPAVAGESRIPVLIEKAQAEHELLIQPSSPDGQGRTIKLHATITAPSGARIFADDREVKAGESAKFPFTSNQAGNHTLTITGIVATRGSETKPADRFKVQIREAGATAFSPFATLHIWLLAAFLTPSSLVIAGWYAYSARAKEKLREAAERHGLQVVPRGEKPFRLEDLQCAIVSAYPGGSVATLMRGDVNGCGVYVVSYVHSESTSSESTTTLEFTVFVFRSPDLRPAPESPAPRTPKMLSWEGKWTLETRAGESYIYRGGGFSTRAFDRDFEEVRSILATVPRRGAG
ncbi:MAG: hypothetical protein HY820_43785 [Acidobacteria bacterium]|nr:hypothetical protein [Acidobacteriota bacterium]